MAPPYPQQFSLAIMWSTMSPDAEPSELEPPELRNLKNLLAKLNCKCSSCSRPRLDHQCTVNKEVQSELIDEVDICPTFSDKNIGVNPFHNDVFCPTCSVTMNLLRGNLIKVLKDEASETEVYTCNQSSETVYECLEKSTSVTNRPYPQISSLTLTDYLSEYSSDLTVAKMGRKRSNHDRVKFVDIQDKPERDTKRTVYANCSCLENFIESIRPPLEDNMVFR